MHVQSPLLLFSTFPVPPDLWVQGIIRYRPHLESVHESWNLGPGGSMYQTSDINRNWNRRSEEGMVTEPLPGFLRALCPAPSSVMPLNSPGGPFYPVGPPPTSDTKKQMWSPKMGEASLLVPDLHQSLLPPFPAQTKSRPASEPRVLQGKEEEEWDRAERTNLPSSFRAHLSNSAPWRETCFILIFATRGQGAWELGRGGWGQCPAFL